MPEKPKVLIVEDEVAIAMDLQSLLETLSYEVVGVAYSYFQAEDLLAKRKPDLVLLDIALKGQKTGIDLAAYINEHYKIPFIYLTSYGNATTIYEAVETKPAAYLVKPFKEKDIAPALALALAKGKEKPSTTFPELDYMNERLENRLSEQEYKVTHLLFEGLTNNDIAEKLFVSLSTVKTHVYNIYQKMGTGSRSETIKKLREM